MYCLVLGVLSMYTQLRQRILRWLGHVRRMEDGCIPKDIIYGELALGRRTTGRYAGCRHRQYDLGRPGSLPHKVECPETTSEDRKIQTVDCSSEQVSRPKGGQQLHQPPKPHIDVISATQTVTPALVSSGTSDAATTQQDINKIKTKALGRITHDHL